MALLIVQHKVRDYETWRAAFDAHDSSRVSAGITNGRVYRQADDPDNIVILLDVAEIAKARAWMAAQDLKSAMQGAGVLSPPVVHFAQ